MKKRRKSYREKKISCVYYAEHQDGRVKIGHTTRLKQRWNSLKGLGFIVLRVEYPVRGRYYGPRRTRKTMHAHSPLLLALERMRQEQFGEYLISGESFIAGERLRAFIDALPVLRRVA